MSFFAYSEIYGLILGAKSSIHDKFLVLTRHDTTKIRFRALCYLAKVRRDTISNILEQIGENRTGGTYISLQTYFENLEIEKILEKQSIGRRTYWKFTDQAKDLAEYLKEVNIKFN